MHLENIQSVKNELKEKERIEAEKAALLKEQAEETEKKIQTAEQLMKELKQQQEFARLKAEMERSFTEKQRKLKAEKEETAQKLQNAVQFEEDPREKAKQILENADQRLKAEIKAADKAFSDQRFFLHDGEEQAGDRHYVRLPFQPGREKRSGGFKNTALRTQRASAGEPAESGWTEDHDLERGSHHSLLYLVQSISVEPGDDKLRFLAGEI